MDIVNNVESKNKLYSWVYTKREMSNYFPQIICTKMFVTTLFIIVKTRNKLNAHQIEEWINNGIFYNEIIP